MTSVDNFENQDMGNRNMREDTVQDKSLASKMFGEMLKIQFGEKKFGDNAFRQKRISQFIIIIWRIKFGDLVKFAKFAKLFSHQTFVLYGIVLMNTEVPQ